MERRVTPQPPLRRTGVPQIEIEPSGAGFAVRVGGRAMRYCGDELDAHHWGKHAFEAVNTGLRSPGEIERAMQRLCLIATRYNLHN